MAGENTSSCVAQGCCAAAKPAAPTAPLAEGAQRSRIRIEQMCCPVEERLIRGKLEGQPGVGQLQFDLLQRQLTLEHAPKQRDAILQSLRELGFKPQLLGPQATPPPSTAQKSWWPLALGAVLALAAEVLHFIGQAPEWSAALLALAAIACSGISTYRKGWLALRNLSPNINALMSLAVTGAVLIGQWPEAAMVMVLFAVAELIEARSLDRARDAIAGLMALSPEQARVQLADGSWVLREVAEVAVGARVRVAPGERVALDGEVRAGQSALNQAPITGESLPVEKAPGDQLFAGTINLTGELEYRVTAPAAQSTLARIILAVEQAQAERAPMQCFVDRFAAVYTPLVMLLSLLVAIVPPLLLGWPWDDWIYRALVLLVVACPCALVISTPVTIVSGLAAAARMGILIKGGVYLEQGHRLQVLALDKTGTLTEGRPQQTDCVRLVSAAELPVAQLAASLAARSDHPVSQAIARHAATAGQSILPVTGFQAVPGQGVRGQIGAADYHLGNHRLVDSLGLGSPALRAQLQALEQQGKSAVVLCSNAAPLAILAVADRLKSSSQEAIAQLHALGVGTLMLSGDNAPTVAAMAAQAGIDEAHGELLPEHKLARIAQQQASGRRVAMVGDGINDAPALAKADIGFAMGAAGSDSAIETADVALMDDDLRKIPQFIRLSRRSIRILWQNIALALGIKVVFLLLTLMGMATLWMAVFADMGTSLLVVANGLRLLRQR
ncbi:Cd2+/Zn2+-exporting ATPase [Halopseudomonas sabulinigri]|uniref:P-type Zn(2+) transporter n=1 Tax=Halopseudomonas sabulinigri TaxID=472181 RepID=A0A1H1T4V9_9GAMM|nr:heavy metal translocating P-type ATPase [Halopseudomonas sabulinigri]SDS55255.1 Cd2+/Zn2+-exporting ATPase [Halopseudomonas sabulinigri]